MLDKALYRIDPLTGCFNLLGYLEWLSNATHRGACSLLSLDVNAFDQYNSTLGRTAGDDVLRWVVLVVEDENPAPMYRIDGDEFVVILEGESLPAQRVLAQRLYERMNQEAERVGLVAPAVTVSLVHYPAQARCTPAEVLALQLTALRQTKAIPGRPPQYFVAGELQVEADIARRLLDGIIQRMVGLGGTLDEMQALAYSDPLTGLPNVRAAEARLQAAGSAALAVLMIDGDNLRLYNDMGGYAAGDRMIQALSGVLRGQLRPDDFLARWRMGDEFLALLPGVDVEGAVAVGRRLCAAVRQASTEWLRPVTISVGAAARSERGGSIDELVAEAEQAKELAKAGGKDRVVEMGG